MTTQSLLKDTRGAAVIEFAFALPAIAMVMVGILQMGMVLHASGGMRHALGEGIRYARINPNATDAQVEEHARAALLGIDGNGIRSLTFDRGTTAGGESFGQIAMRYEIATVIPFVPLPPFELEKTKTTYLPY